METTMACTYGKEIGVLIVPCGMETKFIVNEALANYVLIVPCGMETDPEYMSSFTVIGVLIVPCGMETGSPGIRRITP